MFEAMTFDVIMQRMLANVPDDLDKREGSIIWDALAPAAIELEFAYLCMDYTLNQGFADTAERPYLIRRCQERGLAPYAATKAILKGVFMPANISVVGRRFSLGSLNYVVLQALDDEPGAYQVQCETAGAQGNQVFGRLIPVDYVDGLETATLTELLIPGEDEQDTESLRAEYYASFTDVDYGGNIAGYLQMAQDIPGVGSAKVTPAWQGGGTVKITILDAEYNTASSALIENVQNVIDPKQDGKGDGLAFIDHVVTIDTAAECEINVCSTVIFENGYTWENMQSVIANTISNYFMDLRKNWAVQNALVVRISQIESRILALEGVIDVTDTTLNGAVENLTLSEAEVPRLGTVENQ